MKGTPVEPKCGYSYKICRILDSYKRPYDTVNVLEDNVVREVIKVYSDFPTIPQLYIKGEFIGGLDIVTEMHNSGELKGILSGPIDQAPEPALVK